MTATAIDQQVVMTGQPYGQSDAPVKAGAVLPHGTMAFIDAASGFLTNDDNAGANKYAGIMARRADNTGGANGDIDGVFYAHDNRFELPFNDAITQADIGKKVYAQDNYGLSTTATTAAFVGILEKFVSTSKGLVKPEFAAQ